MHNTDTTEHASHPKIEYIHLFSCFEIVTFGNHSGLHTPRLIRLKSRGPKRNSRGRLRECISAGIFGSFFDYMDNLSRSPPVSSGKLDGEKLKWSGARKMALARDGYRCMNPECGKIHALTVHHIHPRGLGGGNNLENLVTLCESCHQELCARCKRPEHLRSQGISAGDTPVKYSGLVPLRNPVPASLAGPQAGIPSR